MFKKEKKTVPDMPVDEVTLEKVVDIFCILPKDFVNSDDFKALLNEETYRSFIDNTAIDDLGDDCFDGLIDAETYLEIINSFTPYIEHLSLIRNIAAKKAEYEAVFALEEDILKENFNYEA